MTSHGRRGRPPHEDILTPAEWRIVEGIRHGMSGREIARRRGVSVDAVKYHVANVLQKLGLSTRAELRHWRGVRRDSALHGKEERMEHQPMIAPIGQVSRQVTDIEAARIFYGDVLGLSLLHSFGDMAFFDCGGVRLYLSVRNGGASGESILYFRVENIEAAYTALLSEGVPFEGAPHMVYRHEDGTEEWLAFFKDPDEGTLALMAQVRS